MTRTQDDYLSEVLRLEQPFRAILYCFAPHPVDLESWLSADTRHGDAYLRFDEAWRLAAGLKTWRPTDEQIDPNVLGEAPSLAVFPASAAGTYGSRSVLYSHSGVIGGCHHDGIPAGNGIPAANGITAPSGVIPAKAGIQ
jgi:hypothetical protein